MTRLSLCWNTARLIPLLNHMLIVYLQSADWTTDKFLLRWFCTDCPPALHPLIVTLFGSPPKLWIYFWTHLNASCWSWKAKFGYCPLYQKPNGPIHLTFGKLYSTSELQKTKVLFKLFSQEIIFLNTKKISVMSLMWFSIEKWVFLRDQRAAGDYVFLVLIRSGPEFSK